MSPIHALLVYPEFPASYWGYQYALEFVDKKAAMPPLGLLTVAGMFPDHYDLRVIDMNVTDLSEDDIEWADLVFTSTMIVQKRSLEDVIARCNAAQTPIVCGGPHPTSFHENMTGVDHFILDEVERTFSAFLSDWENGVAQNIYREPNKPDVTETPVPRYDLIDMDAYDSMALQFSRGCPFDCEFCDITKLFGRVPRTKSNEQMLAEFDALYELGWRGGIFLVDDNFIGNKRDAMRLLGAVAEWQKERDYPFSLYTEASVNLASMDDLMNTMVEAGFSMVFLGIETPNPKALQITKKGQNVKKGQDDFLLNAVKTIHGKGIEVSAGFILGLDGDTEDAFDAQIDFIQQAGIQRAMVGLLTALKGTDLHKRLDQEGRLLRDSTGNNVDGTLNFVPEMDPKTLVEGFKRVLTTLYDPTLKNYFDRCLAMYDDLGKHAARHRERITIRDIRAFFRSMRKQMLSRQGPAYLQFLTRVLARYPSRFPGAVRSAIMGYHFEKITHLTVVAHEFREYLRRELAQLEEFAAQAADGPADRIEEAKAYAREVRARAQARYAKVQAGVRHAASDALEAFYGAVESHLRRLELQTT